VIGIGLLAWLRQIAIHDAHCDVAFDVLTSAAEPN
jgi:hypothetical protein